MVQHGGPNSDQFAIKQLKTCCIGYNKKKCHVPLLDFNDTLVIVRIPIQNINVAGSTYLTEDTLQSLLNAHAKRELCHFDIEVFIGPTIK
jgi:hypothetical protein